MRIGTALRVLAGVTGVILLGVAARYTVVRSVDIRPAVWVTWWVTAAAVHDVIVAPVAIVAGWLVVRYVPRFMKAPVQAALLLSAVLVAVSWPALRGYGRVASNPTYLPRSYGTGLAMALGDGVGRMWGVGVRPARPGPVGHRGLDASALG